MNALTSWVKTPCMRAVYTLLSSLKYISQFVTSIKNFRNFANHLRIKLRLYTENPNQVLRRPYTVRFARTEPADCPVHGAIVACDMSLECPGHVKIG